MSRLQLLGMPATISSPQGKDLSRQNFRTIWCATLCEAGRSLADFPCYSLFCHFWRAYVTLNPGQFRCKRLVVRDFVSNRLLRADDQNRELARQKQGKCTAITGKYQAACSECSAKAAAFERQIRVPSGMASVASGMALCPRGLRGDNCGTARHDPG